MNNENDSAWVFDSLIGFLQGPIWSAPLITFIEEKSLIFESDVEENEEYQKIYLEYKNLVDLLLSCFMEDMGITPEQFEHACTVNKHTRMSIKFQQNLFEQIWAANDYRIFKKMMVQKNLELQLQALNMIEEKYGLRPASLTYEKDALKDELLIMEDIIQKCTLDDASEDPNKLSENLLALEHERLIEEYNNKKIYLEEALQMSQEENSPSLNVKDPVQEVKEEVQEEGDEEARMQVKVQTKMEAKENRTPLFKSVPLDRELKPKEENVSHEDIQKRLIYLKARRDKLLALKKEARNRQLETNSTRPSSARNVAKAAIKGEQKLELLKPMEASILQIRKSLAARLQAEVVRKQPNS